MASQIAFGTPVHIPQKLPYKYYCIRKEFQGFFSRDMSWHWVPDTYTFVHPPEKEKSFRARNFLSPLCVLVKWQLENFLGRTNDRSRMTIKCSPSSSSSPILFHASPPHHAPLEKIRPPPPPPLRYMGPCHPCLSPTLGEEGGVECCNITPLLPFLPLPSPFTPLGPGGHFYLS